MSTHPFMRLWVGDFVKDTLELDAKEVGAYMLLLMAMWERGGSLPADHNKLRRVARVGRDWPKVWAAIEVYFTQADGKISQSRLTAELNYARTKATRAKQSGSLGGKAKSLKSNERGLANAKRTLSYSEPESYTPQPPRSGGPDNLEFFEGKDPVRLAQAAAIRNCVEWQTRHISQSTAWQLAQDGYITEAECRKAGVL